MPVCMSWSVHITTFTAKASKWLHFLKQLKWELLPNNFCILRCCYPPGSRTLYPIVDVMDKLQFLPVHYAITRAQAEQLGAIQKRAIRKRKFTQIPSIW